jgi:outer membrane protein
MILFSAMKNFRLIVVMAVSLLVAGAVSAQAQAKIASVDMKKLFDSYYKTKLAEDVLDQKKADARKSLKEAADGIEKEQADYKQILDQANDQAISSDARDKLKQSAADKADQINNDKVEFDKSQRRVEAELADQSQRMSANLIGEIQKAVSDQAKRGGYTVVMNSSSVEAVIYVSPDTDITPAVLAQLNAGAPMDVSPPASSGLQLNVGTNSP